MTSEQSNGIVVSCQRLYHDDNTDKYLAAIKSTSRISDNIYDDAYVCFNRLFKWHNSSISGPELHGKA